MEDMDKDMMRQGLLAELIDQMHGRLADKMFPPDPSTASEPAASGITGEGTTATGIPIPRSDDYSAADDVKDGMKVTEHGAPSADSTGIPDEDMSEEDLEEMLKGLDK